MQGRAYWVDSPPGSVSMAPDEDISVRVFSEDVSPNFQFVDKN